MHVFYPFPFVSQRIKYPFRSNPIFFSTQNQKYARVKWVLDQCTILVSIQGAKRHKPKRIFLNLIQLFLHSGEYCIPIGEVGKECLRPVKRAFIAHMGILCGRVLGNIPYCGKKWTFVRTANLKRAYDFYFSEDRK